MPGKTRITTWPLDKQFERLDPNNAFSELALRLVVDFYSDAPQVVGTATVVCGHLLVTARHVLESIPGLHDSRSVDSTSLAAGITVDRSLAAVQVLPGPEYVIWDVVSAIADPRSDIALLRLTSNPAKSLDGPHQWKQLQINPFAPDVGERVVAFGYRRGGVLASKNTDDGHHINLNDESMVSVGIVREIYKWRRDSAMLMFPCYRVSTRFDGGMSGGPVLDEYGSLCGIVCAYLDSSHLDGEPVSYVTTLWPLFRLIIDADRGDNYPRGIRYPVIELARGGQIMVSDLPRLENWFAKAR